MVETPHRTTVCECYCCRHTEGFHCVRKVLQHLLVYVNLSDFRNQGYSCRDCGGLGSSHTLGKKWIYFKWERRQKMFLQRYRDKIKDGRKSVRSRWEQGGHEAISCYPHTEQLWEGPGETGHSSQRLAALVSRIKRPFTPQSYCQ